MFCIPAKHRRFFCFYESARNSLNADGQKFIEMLCLKCSSQHDAFKFFAIGFRPPQRLILQISRLFIALFYKFSPARTPYFTYFAPSHCLILQVFARQNALFYIFCARSLPYFTSFLPPERLILHISRLLTALFYKFSPVRTPYFTNFALAHCLILQVFQ